MKRNILVALLAMFLVTGCDLERLPYDAYSASTIEQDPEAALDVLLNGNYSYLREVYDTYIRYGEYRSENIRKDKPTTAGYWYYYRWDRDPSAGNPNTLWNNCYKVISQSSEIIKMIPEGQNSALDQSVGEAYFLRGLMYFNLVNMFGRPYYQEPDKNLGVPIVNGMPEEGVAKYEFPDRASVRKVYEQIIADYRKAETLCNTYSTVRGSKAAAQAALAKAYLYMSGTYESPNPVYTDSAYYYANRIIESGDFQLLSRDNFMKYNEFAPESAVQTETIFACKVRFEDVQARLSSQLGGQYSRINNVGWGESAVSSIAIELLNEVGTSDWRNGPRDHSGIVDARAAFVVPDYLTPKKRTFIFVTNLYDVSGTHTGFSYKQFAVESTGANDEVLTVKDDEGKVYPVTPVDIPNRRYSIDYNGVKSVGYDDFYIVESQGYPKYYNYRCSLEEGNTQQHSPVISRLSDIILIRAEAAVKKGDYATALNDVNTIRERALPGHGYTSMNATNAKELVQKERHLELIFHGDRSYDIFRVGDSLTRPMPGWVGDPFRVIKPTDLDVVMFIPSQQINAWPTTLTQNP